MNGSAKPFILATAGHVDHGKTSIVRALTGTDTDRLPAEKARGMTIELGFAHLALTGANGSYDIGLVDVPGHERFVRNMVAGIGSIDAALIVVAADDGWMPQTEEHLQILTYCGVSRAVIALNKCDLATDITASIASVRDRLVGTAFATSPIVPTASVTGAGIDELRDALAKMFDAASPHADHGKPRLAVDRAFLLKGLGTIVTGTLTGGVLRKGDAVIVQPAGHATRARTLQSHGRDTQVACPGSRVAINLPDVHVGDGAGPLVSRGDLVSVPGVGVSTRVFDVAVDARFRESDAALESLPRSGELVMLHHGTSIQSARLRWLDAKRLARIRVDSPLHVMSFDRIVFRSASQRRTLAGGIVLDPTPPKRGRKADGRNDAHLELLKARCAAPGDLVVYITSQVMRDHCAELGDLQSVLDASSTEIAAAIDTILATNTVRRSGEMLLDVAKWKAVLIAAKTAIDLHHERHPDQRGLAITMLRNLIETYFTRCRMTASPGALFSLLIEDLLAVGFVKTAEVIHRAMHRPALPPRLRQAGEQLREILAARPFDPPSKKELTRTDAQLQALKYLIAAGELIEIGSDVVLSSEAYLRVIVFIRNHLRAVSSATVSELKAVAGSSRRIMVPLLERLDRERITKRVGDRRTLVDAVNQPAGKQILSDPEHR